MIPKKSTPIKNELLINIFAKGLLNKDEMRIIFYIIRWSWGFDGVERRQDWTKKLTKRQIADNINIDRGKCCYILNKMIKENKVIVNNKCYQFNEHYKDWIKLTISQPLQKDKVDDKSINNRRKVNPKLIKGQSKVDDKSISTDPKPIQDKPLRDRKETLKETNTKETIKKTSKDSFNNESVVYQLVKYLDGKIRENNEAENKKPKKTEKQLQSWCIEMDKLIRIDHAKTNDIKKVIDWVVEDDFWSPNLLSAIKLRKHYSRFYKKVIDRGRSLEEKLATDHRFDNLK